MADKKPFREIMLTADGSHTVAVPELQVSYHSRHGAIQESMHVFIEAGFRYLLKLSNPSSVRILELGFGTGLNALLTMDEAKNKNISVYYEAIELYPLEANLVEELNYVSQPGIIDPEHQFIKLHECDWNEATAISPRFTLHKIQNGFYEYLDKAGHDLFDLVYFDAFAPTAQPELWEQAMFAKLIRVMKPGALLVTYCSKGSVRRTMQAAGLQVEKLKGPPGKREMVRARKTNV